MVERKRINEYMIFNLGKSLFYRGNSRLEFNGYFYSQARLKVVPSAKVETLLLGLIKVSFPYLLPMALGRAHGWSKWSGKLLHHQLSED